MSWKKDDLANQMQILANAAKAIGKAAMQTNGSNHAEGWLCLCRDCDYALNGTRNYPGRHRCNFCLRPKTTATNPPEYARLPKKYDKDGTLQGTPATLGTSDKETKKREARTRRRQARAEAKKGNENTEPNKNACTVAAVPSPEPATSAPPAASPKAVKEKVTLPEKLCEQIQFLMPVAIKPILESLAVETVPIIPDAKSAEDVVSKTIGQQSPTAKLAKKTEIQADIVRLKEALILFQGGGEAMTKIREGMEAELKAQEEALAKALKGAPSPDHELKALQQARSSYEVTIQERKDNAAKGEAKALARRTARHKHVEELRSQLKLLEDELNVIEDNNTKLHVEKTTLAAELDTKVLKLIDEKIAAITRRLATDASTPPPPPQQGTLALALLQDQAPPTAQAATDHLNTQKVAMEQQLAQLQAAFKAHQEQEAIQQALDKVVDTVSLEALPTVTLQGKDELEVSGYGRVYRFLSRWLNLGASTPFTIDEMGKSLQLKPEAIGLVLDAALGNKTADWIKDATTIVPRQCCMFAHHSLSKLKAEYDALQNATSDSALALKAYEDLSENAKKRKKS